jgi:type IV pilus assembly protein PilB
MPEPSQGNRILDILLQRGALSEEILAAARTAAGSLQVEKYLVQNQFVSPAEMTLAISEYVGMPPITLQHFSPDPQLVDMLPSEVWQRLNAFPLARHGPSLLVALGDPFDIVGLDELNAQTGLQVQPLVASEKEVNDLLARLTTASTAQDVQMEDILKDSDSEIEVGREEQPEESLEKTLESAEGAPVIRMVNVMLIEALKTRASDIHIEPMEKSTRLRYRVDGVLMERPSPPKAFHSAIVSRVKIMSDLNIAERRLPQDGRFRIKAVGKEVDIRVSVLPTVHGEKVVMRALDRSSLAPNLDALGLDEYANRAMKHAIAQPHGIILVTGPTGSGKTTTLYSCLQELNTRDVNIVTVEDPVEYQLAGINQVHVHAAVGLSFASVLRSVLRQDPDIILVGEIRDGETADIAVKAALTGHLVLSTLHTNDAPGAMARLIDMGVPAFLLASSLILAQAQRLYRKLCPVCKQEAVVPREKLEANRIDPSFFAGCAVYKAVGCPKCNNLGYRGRGAMMEVLPVDDAIRDAIVRGKTSGEIRAIAVARGMITLKNAGLAKVKEGLTSIEAAIEATGSE